MEGYELRIGHQILVHPLSRSTLFWGHCKNLNFLLEDNLQLFPGLWFTQWAFFLLSETLTRFTGFSELFTFCHIMTKCGHSQLLVVDNKYSPAWIDFCWYMKMQLRESRSHLSSNILSVYFSLFWYSFEFIKIIRWLGGSNNQKVVFCKN